MNPIPKHIAIIMDGNGRWAESHNLPRIEGHRKGVEAVENVVEACRNMGVSYLTLYAFSDENWERPKEEVTALMQMLAHFVKAKCQKMLDNDLKFGTIGNLDLLPPPVLAEVEAVKKATANCKGMNLILALSYGAHAEICRAFERLIKEKREKIVPADIESRLDTAGIPSPDLLIRTSGEQRLSNFLLWQLAYAELYFTETLWPAFGEEELLAAVEDYRNRERRFGRVASK